MLVEVVAAGTRGSSRAGDEGSSSDQTRLTPGVPSGGNNDVFSGGFSMVFNMVPVC